MTVTVTVTATVTVGRGSVTVMYWGASDVDLVETVELATVIVTATAMGS